MKTMEKNGVVKRVQDKSASMLVKQGWKYTSKKAWKSLRDGGAVVQAEEAPANMKKTKKNKKVKKVDPVETEAKQ